MQSKRVKATHDMHEERAHFKDIPETKRSGCNKLSRQGNL